MEDWGFLNMQIKNNINNFAFTLLEISITIMIIGILTIAGINFHISMIQNSHKNITLDKLNRIEKAINEYILQNGQLPCPSDITFSSNNVSYGKELRNSSGECYVNSSIYLNNDLIYGSIPTKTLGLTDDYAVDAWKNSIIYIIDKKYGKKSTFLSSGGEAINVKNLNDKTITNKAIYFLFSSGFNKNGAFRDGKQNTSDTNIEDYDNVFKNNFDKYFVKDVINDTFDDIVIYKEKDNILLEADLEDILCNLNDLKMLDNNWNYTTNVNCPDKKCQQSVEIISSSPCPNGYISKNPNINTVDNTYRPSRKCLKYGKWSDIMYPCILGCGESNINNVVGGNFLSPGELKSAIDEKYLKRVALNEEITLECINNDMVGYITLKCNADGEWEYISGNCINKLKVLN